MFDLKEIRTLLALQAQAYQLLLWAGDRATQFPELLGPDAAAQLQEPATVPRWLDANRDLVPAAPLPEPWDPRFAELLASFFTTSFLIRHLEFEGRLVESRLTVGAAPGEPGNVGLTQCMVLALRHLAASENLPITGKDAGLLVNGKGLREPVVVWTYAWELDRRSRGKAKGAVVHRLWGCIPRETRKSLDADRIWAAREQLLDAVRTLYESTPEAEA